MNAMLTFARHSLCVEYARIDTDERQQEVLRKQSTSVMPPYAQIIQKRHNREESETRDADVFFSGHQEASDQGFGF